MKYKFRIEDEVWRFRWQKGEGWAYVSWRNEPLCNTGSALTWFPKFIPWLRKELKNA